MPRSEISPADLDGKALRRWYQRSPEEIERERSAAAEAASRAYFGGQSCAPAPPKLDMAQELRRREQGAYDGFPGNNKRQNAGQILPRPDSWRQNCEPNWSGGIRPVPLPSPSFHSEGGWIRPVPLPSPRLPYGGIRPIPLVQAGPNGSLAHAAGPSAANLQAQPAFRTSGGPATPSNPSQPQPRPQSERHDVWIRGRQPGEIDPSRTDVFQVGPDEKLHPVPG